MAVVGRSESGRLIVLVVALAAGGGCAGDPTAGTPGGSGDACADDPAVFEYCGDGDSFDPNDPNLITWFDSIDAFNERQVSMWRLPAGLVGAKLVDSTNKPASSPWASCARYEADGRWWEICRRRGGNTELEVTATGTT